MDLWLFSCWEVLILQSTLQCATDFVSSGESLCKLRGHICVEVVYVLFHQAEVSRSLEKSITLIGKIMQAFGPIWGIRVLVVCVFLTFVWVMGLQVHICVFGCRDYNMPCYLYRSHCCWNQPWLLSLMCILLQCQNCTKFWHLYYSSVNITIGFPSTLGSLSSKVSITVWSILDPCL